MLLTLNKGTNILKVDKTIIKGIVTWGNRIPYYDCVNEIKKLRKQDPKANFPSNVVMDEIFFHQWNAEDFGGIKSFMIDFMTTPCKEWIAYGPENEILEGNVIQYSKEGWTSVIDGIPKETIEQYNEEIKQGRNAALFIETYNDGLPVVEKKLFKKRIIITPNKEGIVVIKNFLRENAGIGEVDDRTRTVIKVENPDELPVRRKRSIYTVWRNISYVGPLSRNYGRLLLIIACDGPSSKIGVLASSD